MPNTVPLTSFPLFIIRLDNVSPNLLLKEFPDPKNLLNSTISRSLGVSDLSQLIQYSCEETAGVKVRTHSLVRGHVAAVALSDRIVTGLFPQKATVTVQWPCRIEEEGFASKKVDAERFAAAAACSKLKVRCRDACVCLGR